MINMIGELLDCKKGQKRSFGREDNSVLPLRVVYGVKENSDQSYSFKGIHAFFFCQITFLRVDGDDLKSNNAEVELILCVVISLIFN